MIFAIVALLLGTVPAQGTGRITSWDSNGETARVQDVRLTAFGSFAVPLGEFGQAGNSPSGFALAGAGGGLELSAHYRQGAEVGAALWIDQNRGDGDGLAKHIEQQIENLGLAVPAGGYHVSMSRWTSVWGLLRIGYSQELSRELRAFGAGYVGAVYARSPDVDIVVAPPGISSRTAGHAYLGHAAGVGAGVRWGEHVTLGMHFLIGSMEPHGWSPGVDVGRKPIAELQAAVGYGFGL